MAIKLMSREWVPFTHDYRCEYICDTDADFASLPESSVGSSAISLESGKVYVVSTFGNWIPFGEGYVEKDPNAPLPAGLYVDGVMTASWDELVSNGAITVENNVITGSNADALVGDLVIAEGITEIGEEALSCNTALKTIAFPASLEVIGEWAISESSVETITFAEGSRLKTIGDNAFHTSSLTSIVIPDAVTNFGALVFENCTSLTSVKIGKGVTRLDISFNECYALETLVLPDSITFIDDDTFYRCRSLVSITFEGTMAQWNAIELGEDWNREAAITEVICTDGKVAL